MNFSLALLKALVQRPGQALGALYWHVTGRKVRARNRLRLVAAQSPQAYSIWMRTIENLRQLQKESVLIMRNWAYHPRFSIILYLDPAIPTAACAKAVRSVLKQFYMDWELVLVRHTETANDVTLSDGRMFYISDKAANAAQALNMGIAAATGDYILPLKGSDELSPAALFYLGHALQGEKRPSVLYGDEDHLTKGGNRTQPWFKPAWNEEMFLAQDYISACCLMETEAARHAPPVPDTCAEAAIYTLMLHHLTAVPDCNIAHIPHILCHRGTTIDRDTLSTRLRVVARHLNTSGAKVIAGRFASVRVVWPLPDNLPLISIIVPTRDKVKLLRKCVRGIITNTSYPNIELLIVDNNSTKRATHRYFAELSRDSRVHIIHFPGAYNYSAINNYAVTQARGTYICLLNNDTEIIDPDWLTELMRQAARPHVGAVGAKLLYGDGSIQHAGVVIGLGPGEAAGHAHRFLGKGKGGYFNQPHLPQYVSAVTAACLLVEKRKFEAVNGFDADNLAVAFNDVDLCLKLGAAHWRNVYSPQAVLIHHESKSRGRDASPKHVERYRKELNFLQQRWNIKNFQDPNHNPNLSRATETFQLDL